MNELSSKNQHSTLAHHITGNPEDSWKPKPAVSQLCSIKDFHADSCSLEPLQVSVRNCFLLAELCLHDLTARTAGVPRENIIALPWPTPTPLKPTLPFVGGRLVFFLNISL